MVQPINDNYSVAGQVNSEQLQQAANQGFKSVLNLRSPDEEGFLSEESAIVKSLGLEYVSAPLTVANANSDQLLQLAEELDKLPKPTLIHCAGGMRASAIALLNTARREGLTLEQALEQAKAAGFDYNANPKLKQLFEQTMHQLEKGSD